MAAANEESDEEGEGDWEGGGVDLPTSRSPSAMMSRARDLGGRGGGSGGKYKSASARQDRRAKRDKRAKKRRKRRR